MALNKDEAKMLENVLKTVVSKMGGSSENPVKKILKKKRTFDRYVSKPRESGKFPMYSDFAKKLYFSNWDKPVDYGRARTPMSG